MTSGMWNNILVTILSNSAEKFVFKCAIVFKNRLAEHLLKKMNLYSISKGLFVHKTYLYHLMPLRGSTIQWPLYFLYLFSQLCLMFHVSQKIKYNWKLAGLISSRQNFFCFTMIIISPLPGYMSSPYNPTKNPLWSCISPGLIAGILRYLTFVSLFHYSGCLRKFSLL